MGAPRAPEAHVSRRPSRREERQGLLRVRRAGEAKDIDDLRTDTAKASIWAAVSAIAILAPFASGPGLPSWTVLASALGYALMLPAIAILHVRHQQMRESGAVLGTVAGVATVCLGIAISGNDTLTIGALFVRGIWWWTIGKLWLETSLLPSWLAAITMALAVLAFAIAVGTTFGVASLALPYLASALLGLWLIGLAYALWRIR